MKDYILNHFLVLSIGSSVLMIVFLFINAWLQERRTEKIKISPLVDIRKTTIAIFCTGIIVAIFSSLLFVAIIFGFVRTISNYLAH